MEEQQESTKICPYCAETVKKEAVKCKHCGSDLTLPPERVVFNATGLVPLDHSFTGSMESGTIIFNKYMIIDLIGQGGMGCVYQAREIDFEVDRTVAIKVLPPNLLQDDRLARRFEEEIKIAAKMDHPNIVPIYNIGRHGQLLFFVMKYIHGKTLKQVIRAKGRLDEAFIRDVGRQVAEALGYIHKNGTIHRDIKTNNIMVDDSGHATLMDFGIAKADGGTVLTTSGEILGTGPYMSPEQWDGQIDHRSDIYSFGVVLYELATGHLPFQSETLPELMRKIIEDPAPPIAAERPDLSSELCGLIEKCLLKKADDRFQAMPEVCRFFGEKTVFTDAALIPPPQDTPTVVDNRTPRAKTPTGGQVQPLGQPLWKKPGFLIPIAALAALLVFMTVFPLAAPYPASLALEGLGDTSARIGFFTSPPGINAYQLYDAARRLRNNKEPLIEKQNRIYQYYCNAGKNAYSTNRFSTAVKYFKKAMKLRPWDLDTVKDYNKALAKRNEKKS